MDEPFWDAKYTDEKTKVFWNHFGVQNGVFLEKIEALFTAARAAELDKKPLKTKFDLTHLKSIHKHLFQDVYPWAGEVRIVNIAKNKTNFLPCSHIDRGMAFVTNGLVKENYLKGLSPEHFAARAAYFFSDLNHIHPFREGNGRTQRVFIEQLARQAGYSILWENMTQAQMIVASIQGNYGELSLMENLFLSNLIDLKSKKSRYLKEVNLKWNIKDSQKKISTKEASERLSASIFAKANNMLEGILLDSLTLELNQKWIVGDIEMSDYIDALKRLCCKNSH